MASQQILHLNTFIFFAFIWISNAQKTPSIGFISPDVVADIGGTAELTCKITNENPSMKYPVMWLRLENGHKGDRPLPITSGDTKLLSDDRFTIEVDDEAHEYKLTIKKIRVSDAAKYQCQILISEDGSVAEDVEIKIKLPPIIKKEDLSPTKTVKEGESVDLACEASGFPSPKITWTRKDGSLLPNGKVSFPSSRMTVQKVRREDRGIYVCTASNGVGKDQQKSTSLEVEFSPKIKVPSPRIPQALYHDAHLSCEIEAFPPPAIYWKKNNETIKNNGTFQIAHFASADEKMTTQLKVFETTMDQFGLYTCEAMNLLGKDSQALELYKSKVPILQPLDLNSGFKSKEQFIHLSLFFCLLSTILFL